MKPATASRYLSTFHKVRRDAIWQTLLENDAPQAWHPSWIDIALNDAPRNVTFHALCSIVASAESLASLPFEVEATDFFNGDGRALQAWLLSKTNKQLWDQRLREDGVSLLYGIVLRAIEKFRPSTSCGDAWSSCGFEAFLHLRARSLTHDSMRACAPCGDFEIEAIPKAQLVVVADDFRRHDDLRQALIRALRASLNTIDKWTCVYAMAYQNQSLRDVAQERNTPRSSFSRRVARPVAIALKKALRAYSGMCSPLKAADLASITEIIPLVFFADDFRDLVPPPQTLGQSASLPEFNRRDASSTEHT